MISPCRNAYRVRVPNCRGLYKKNTNLARVALADTARRVLRVGRLHGRLHAIKHDDPEHVWRRGLNACIHVSPWGNRADAEPLPDWAKWGTAANVMMWNVGHDLARGLGAVPDDMAYGLAVAGLDHLVEETMGVENIVRNKIYSASDFVGRGWSDMEGRPSLDFSLQEAREQLFFDLVASREHD